MTVETKGEQKGKPCHKTDFKFLNLILCRSTLDEHSKKYLSWLTKWRVRDVWLTVWAPYGAHHANYCQSSSGNGIFNAQPPPPPSNWPPAARTHARGQGCRSRVSHRTRAPLLINCHIFGSGICILGGGGGFSIFPPVPHSSYSRVNIERNQSSLATRKDWPSFKRSSSTPTERRLWSLILLLA